MIEDNVMTEFEVICGEEHINDADMTKYIVLCGLECM
jgi:hypothetical protein